MKTFDVAVLGVGGMGSAACHHLAASGLRVLGLEQFSIPNTRGSSHGATRILRLGLHESARYVPLVLRAAELWEEVGARTGRQLFHRCGSLDVARPESPIFTGSLHACQNCGIAHEVLDAPSLRRRFPALNPDDDMLAVHQPGSGFILPEAAISAHIDLALDAGAEIHGHETVLDWAKEGSSYLLRTNRDTYQSTHVVATAGAWIGKLLPQVPVTAERTVLGWFAPIANRQNFSGEKLPVWIVDSPEAGHFYGFPMHGVPGFKLGRLREQPSPAVDPDLPRRSADRDDEEDMRSFLRCCFPDANGPILSLETCFFENTPDRAPIIDRLPGEENFWIAGGFSGHGFKYAAVIGEIVRDLVLQGVSAFNLTPFSLSRFAPQP